MGIFTAYIPAAGSFRSLEAANKLVRSTIADPANRVLLDQVISGERVRYVTLNKTFASPTGIEAYVPAADRPPPITFRRKLPPLKPRVRTTYAVRVVIRHDPLDRRGYRVVTAFPWGP